MNKRPGQVRVTIETGYCSFCGRPRNLRREEHQLGTLVRTILTCETCHRTLSSFVGVATAEPASAEPAAAETPVQAEAVVQPAAPPTAKAPARPKAAPAKKAAKPATRGGKPTSTATRRVTKKK